MEEKFKVLKVLSENPSINQRNLSGIIGVSLGKINSILKECSEKKLLLKSLEGRYLLTNKGYGVLEEYLKSIKETKLSINEESYYPISYAVILAAGKRDDFDIPVGALKIEDFMVIERNIQILKESGIKNIVIVTGYKKEYFTSILSNESNVKFVNNDRYKWTGTMTSLALAKNYIKDDFILIEGDLVYETRAIKELINNKKRDCVLITNESGSGDEAFVQLKNGYLFKMAKDIHQFNRIDGEMIGISKISYKLFNMMIKEFEGNINQYLNYEYMILDMSRDYKVYCIKIDDLAWGEIDTLNQFNITRNSLYPKIKRRDLELEIESIKLLMEEYLGISKKEVGEVILAGGMTNRNYKVSINEEYYILRIPGVGTENMISRKNEMINSNLASELGLNVDILSFDYEKGIKVSKFIVGAETINARTAKKEENMKLIANILRKLHNSNIEMKNEFDVFSEIIKYEKIIKDNNGKLFDDYLVIRPKIMRLKELIIEYGFKLTPSHNDTVPENFIKDKNGKIFLIDWEYSGLNDEMWDLAAHCLECDFSEDDRELFLQLYFNRKARREEKLRLLMNQICQDFLWAIWTVIKELEGDDFGSYGIDRYNRAKNNMRKLEELM